MPTFKTEDDSSSSWRENTIFKTKILTLENITEEPQRCVHHKYVIINRLLQSSHGQNSKGDVNIAMPHTHTHTHLRASKIHGSQRVTAGVQVTAARVRARLAEA